MKNLKETPEGYREIVSKSLTKSYTEADRKRIGMEPTKKLEVFRQASWALYRCEPAGKSEHLPVLMIPSLINRNYIMDLLPGHSLLEAIKSAGIDLFIIDWGIPDAGMGECGFDHYVSKWVKRAIRHVRKITGAEKVQLAGQCLGGLMAALYAAHPELKKDVDRLFLLTAPLDLEDSGLLAQWTSTDGFDIEKMTAPFQGIVPAEFFHASFPLLDPKKQLSKYRTLLENYEMPGFKEIWESLDIWANDNVPFAKKAFIELIKDFYQENRFYKGRFQIGGRPVSVKEIDIPTLSLVARDDHVFNERAARAINEAKCAKQGKLEYHVIPAGHVTVIAAHPARTESYKIINNFLTR
ncbi:MAG: alpha/beta fold hydrolase [Candidatus Rifleibacteriota bacterium]